MWKISSLLPLLSCHTSTGRWKAGLETKKIETRPSNFCDRQSNSRNVVSQVARVVGINVYL